MRNKIKHTIKVAYITVIEHATSSEKHNPNTSYEATEIHKRLIFSSLLPKIHYTDHHQKGLLKSLLAEIHNWSRISIWNCFYCDRLDHCSLNIYFRFWGKHFKLFPFFKMASLQFGQKTTIAFCQSYLQSGRSRPYLGRECEAIGKTTTPHNFHRGKTCITVVRRPCLSSCVKLKFPSENRLSLVPLRITHSKNTRRER